MEDTLQAVRECLKKASHPILKDFQENVAVKPEAGESAGRLEVFSVTSSDPVIGATHSLQVKYSKDPGARSLLQTEYDAGQFIEATCAGHTNKPLYLEEGCLVLEAEAGHKPMWTQIAESCVDKVGVQQLALVLARLHSVTTSSPSTSLPAGSAECTERQRQSLFHQPYAGNGTAGNQSDQVKGLVDRLQGNQTVRSAVDRVEALYAEKKESLVHGDLSLCNVTVKDGKPKLVNLRYSRPGPCGLDLGVLLASYMAQYSVHMVTPEDNDAHRRVAYKMMDACTTTVETYLQEVRPVLSESEVKTLISETAGFAACELIRRSVGSDPYPGLTDNPAAISEIFDAGMRLLTKYEGIDNTGRLLMIGLALC